MSFSKNIQAQDASISIDKRLYEVFDVTFLDNLKEKNPFHLQYYNFFLDNGYSVIDLPAGKKSSYPEVKIDDLSNFNILKIQNEQQLKRSYEEPTVYKIKGSNQFLMLRSEKEFIKMLNEHLGRSTK